MVVEIQTMIPIESNSRLKYILLTQSFKKKDYKSEIKVLKGFALIIIENYYLAKKVPNPCSFFIQYSDVSKSVMTIPFEVLECIILSGSSGSEIMIPT